MTPTINQRVRYQETAGATLTNVIAYVLAVHEDGTIDLGWAGHLGGYHPANVVAAAIAAPRQFGGTPINYAGPFLRNHVRAQADGGTSADGCWLPE